MNKPPFCHVSSTLEGEGVVKREAPRTRYVNVTSENIFHFNVDLASCLCPRVFSSHFFGKVLTSYAVKQTKSFPNKSKNGGGTNTFPLLVEILAGNDETSKT